ncbi:transporter substrate-binding domain-containing protein [Oceanospirillum sediminis]|uniref:Transporter substrate-binding domain-containing protein n=1 Tax=Oceanospirillum sediminis TaxID=2760088 RepID=A0A839IQC9_9GAMM|nr:transporter substrate-binding domain-containing protein [Oceanospirillum sediminis]MBB1487703.1 transporter substrate-binding domain-containing protein [Oceanospirillum sediminis]
MGRHLILQWIAVSIAVLWSGVVQAQCQKVDAFWTEQPLRVAVKFSPPFVFEANVATQNNGGWDGLAVELWQSIAACLKADSIFIEYTNDSNLLRDVQNGAVDLAIGPFVPSSDAEVIVDFSHSFFQGHLGVMVANQSGLSSIGRLFAEFPLTETLSVLGMLLLLMLLTALLYWRAEYSKANPLFTKGPLRGFYNAMIWATLLVFSGQGNPFEIKHRGGQVLVILLMFFGVSIVSIVTALLTSALTLQGLGSQITSVDELAAKKVAYMESIHSETTGPHVDHWLRENGVNHPIRVLSWPQAVSALQDNRLEALVHSREVMQYLVKADYIRGTSVLPLSLSQTDYAFILPEGSPLTENINRQLLSQVKTELWQQRQEVYLKE